jgi:hypothetical protein
MKALKRILAAILIRRSLKERDLPLEKLESKLTMGFFKSGETSQLHQVLKYNRILERIMFPFLLAGPMKGSLQELSVFLMTRKKVRNLVNSAYM